jgi:hypothetical protein
MRSFSVEHLVENNTHGPDVTFGGIGAAIEDLGTHVHGATNQGLVDLI